MNGNQVSAGSPDHHLIQLDSLRAFAVIAVLLDHTLPQSNLLNRLGIGFLGVRLFFVLSGFLITGILLRARNHAEIKNTSKAPILRAFYARRFLRIFPVYYFILFLYAALGLKVLTQTFFWHFFYLTNYYLAFTGQWLDPISHFWSLAVEEQFYLFWPMLMLFLPKRAMTPILFITILIAPAARYALALIYQNGITAKSPCIACMDMLGMGAALAYFWFHHGSDGKPTKRFVLASLSLGLILLAVSFISKGFSFSWAARVASLDFSVALIFTWLVHAAARGFSAPGKFVFEWRPLLFLGKISYGIYLYHNLMPWTLDKILRALGKDSSWVWEQGPRQFIWVFALTVMVATLSWKFLERPINDQKKRFPYA